MNIIGNSKKIDKSTKKQEQNKFSCFYRQFFLLFAALFFFVKIASYVHFLNHSFLQNYHQIAHAKPINKGSYQNKQGNYFNLSLKNILPQNLAENLLEITSNLFNAKSSTQSEHDCVICYAEILQQKYFIHIAQILLFFALIVVFTAFVSQFLTRKTQKYYFSLAPPIN